ncbi:MAG: slipin family protein [Dinghuibacter sp.]|nr:slipin family protein [Dinghuibacter sp.]
MKKVQVHKGRVGLVFKKGNYQEVLTAGTYWFWRGEQVMLFDITREFNAPVELGLLLHDEQLAGMLHLVEVGDNEIALHYENGLLKQVLTAGRYAFWKGVIRYEWVKADIGKVDITENIGRTTLQHPLLAKFVRSYTIENYEKGVLFVEGKFAGVLGNGVYFWWKNNTAIHVGRVDTRMQQLEINGQEMLTRDKAALRINAWAKYKVTDIEKALLQNKEYDMQLYVAVQLALREYIGGMGFDELLEKKTELSPFVLQRVQETAAALGVEVSAFGIRDVILPGDVKEIMSQVLVAEKKAQANTIMRREETASTRSLLNTAKLMEDNAMLWKLKEMEYVEKIAEKISAISVSGNSNLVEQLKQIFSSQK